MVRFTRYMDRCEVPIAMTEAKRSLKQITDGEVPINHPIRVFLNEYQNVTSGLGQSQLPSLELIEERINPTVLDYSMLMEPVPGEHYLDFAPLRKGANVPGIDNTRVLRGELYTHGIAAHLAEERIMELASSIILERHFLTAATSARNRTLNVRVFRGVFPVWQSERQKPGILLLIALPYAEVR